MAVDRWIIWRSFCRKLIYRLMQIRQHLLMSNHKKHFNCLWRKIVDAIMNENFQLAKNDKIVNNFCATLRVHFYRSMSQRIFLLFMLSVAWCIRQTTVVQKPHKKKFVQKKNTFSSFSTHKNNIKQLCNYEIFFIRSWALKWETSRTFVRCTRRK